jgi:hypothetical protein
MKTQKATGYKSVSLDRFLEDVSEVLEIPRRRLNEIVFQFQVPTMTAKPSAPLRTSKKRRTAPKAIAR